MSRTLKAKADLDWRRVFWSRAESPTLCSYCSIAFRRGDQGLRIWDANGNVARFCADCVDKWFEVK